MERSTYSQIDVGVSFGEAVEAVNEPLGREIRRGADRQCASVLTLQQALGPIRNPIEGVAYDHQDTRAPLL